ncbi:heavy-metal-associated domain-containing protein [bacterium]|nr:heavy-metal-associated domain-containing protein [bacterium]
MLFRFSPTRRGFVFTCFISSLLWSGVDAVLADEKPKATTIDIKGMHCQGCATKVQNRLTAVKNVNSATVSAKTAQATVNPKADAKPSPRALWEAVEAAGYSPTKLVGPDGTFTMKPPA